MELSEQAQITRKGHAERLLRDPVLLEAFEGIKKSYNEQILQAPIRDIEGIQFTIIKYRMIELVKEELASYIENGKLEQNKRDWTTKYKGEFRVA